LLSFEPGKICPYLIVRLLESSSPVHWHDSVGDGRSGLL